jgi:hypothetical protein
MGVNCGTESVSIGGRGTSPGQDERSPVDQRDRHAGRSGSRGTAAPLQALARPRQGAQERNDVSDGQRPPATAGGGSRSGTRPRVAALMRGRGPEAGPVASATATAEEAPPPYSPSPEREPLRDSDSPPPYAALADAAPFPAADRPPPYPDVFEAVPDEGMARTHLAEIGRTHDPDASRWDPGDDGWDVADGRRPADMPGEEEKGPLHS